MNTKTFVIIVTLVLAVSAHAAPTLITNDSPLNINSLPVPIGRSLHLVDDSLSPPSATSSAQSAPYFTQTPPLDRPRLNVMLPAEVFFRQQSFFA